MSKTLLSVKIDQDLKTGVKELATKLGLTLSGLVNAVLKQFVRDQTVIFSAIPEVSRELHLELRRIMKKRERVPTLLRRAKK
jgi:antitoxin component of RelBE/YafQ-DinJ toxin-antitoxin module